MKILFLWGLFSYSFSLLAGISVISDLDDTIKITQASGNPRDLLGSKIYTGMPDFYRAVRASGSHLYVLSASPELLRAKIKKILSNEEIFFKKLILRKNIFEDKFSYKVREISKIMNQSEDDFIFIGDDIGKDPEVFAEMSRRFPDRVLKSYIHKVTGRQMPEELTLYWTSFDLILNEFESSRVESYWVESIFKKLIKEENLNLIFPRNAHCPDHHGYWEWQMRTLFMQEALQLSERFTTFCQLRPF